MTGLRPVSGNAYLLWDQCLESIFSASDTTFEGTGRFSYPRRTEIFDKFIKLFKSALGRER
jgi:hypothetical protein